MSGSPDNVIRLEQHGGQAWRQLQCVSCRGYFYETHGTIFHGKRASQELIVRVIACLAEGPHCGSTVLCPGRVIPPQTRATAPS